MSSYKLNQLDRLRIVGILGRRRTFVYIRKCLDLNVVTCRVVE